MLLAGRGDVAAACLIPLPEDTGRVVYTRALYHTSPVLVQRNGPPGAAAKKLPEPVDTMLKPGPAEPRAIPVRARLVRRPAELAGQRVTIPDKGPYTQTLLELADSVTGDIDVVEVDSSSEALIRGVARGVVAYTLAEGNIAKLQGGYYGNLLIRPVVGAAKPVAWAVRRDAGQLRDTLDAWIGDEKKCGVMDRLYRKYFVDARGYSAGTGASSPRRCTRSHASAPRRGRGPAPSDCSSSCQRPPASSACARARIRSRTFAGR